MLLLFGSILGIIDPFSVGFSAVALWVGQFLYTVTPDENDSFDLNL